VEVIPHGLASVDGNRVVASDGTAREVDAILLGTGFHYSDPQIAGRVAGPDGRTLEEIWQGSPQAYLGTSVHGFPNLFMLLGPNMGSGTGSAIASIEAQVRYLVSALTTMRKQKWHSVDVRESVQRQYNDEVQRALSRTVYAGGCASNYIDRNGRISTVWPWTTVRMNRRIKDFVPAEYRAEHDATTPVDTRGVETIT
jgi:cyclohexanone monooxygenase